MASSCAEQCLPFSASQVHHTFATAGSDGAFNYWDKDTKQRLKVLIDNCISYDDLNCRPVMWLGPITLVSLFFYSVS